MFAPAELKSEAYWKRETTRARNQLPQRRKERKNASGNRAWLTYPPQPIHHRRLLRDHLRRRDAAAGIPDPALRVAVGAVLVFVLGTWNL